jgi:hypothetical protein
VERFVMKDPVRVARSHLANAIQWKQAEAEAAARQELAAAKIERAIREDRANTTPAERQRLAAMLTGGER